MRSFLEKYHNGEVGDHNSSGQDSLPRDGFVVAQQMGQWGEADEHRILIQDYEIRLEADKNRHFPSNEFRIPDSIFSVEELWDSKISEHGLSAFTTYVPFHEEPDEVGIYIQQRSLHYLGHLFYEWSRVAGQASTFDRQASDLLGKTFSKTNELLFEQPAFGSRQEAFVFAREFLVRYQWFAHQIEMLAAYIEDTSNRRCWSKFINQDQARPDLGLIEMAATGYTARSSALGNLSPPGISRRLLTFRALSAQFPSLAEFKKTVDRHEDICAELSAELGAIVADTSPTSLVGGLGRELPFGRDPHKASPEQLPIYVTRNEFDPDDGMSGRGVALETDWEITESPTWESTYESAHSDMKQAAKKAKSKMEKNVRYSGFNWKACKPKNQWYFRLNNNYRGIANINNETKTITLIDFGDHDSPASFGCY